MDDNLLAVLGNIGPMAASLVVVILFLKHLKEREVEHNAQLRMFSERMSKMGDDCHRNQKEISQEFKEAVKTIAQDHGSDLKDIAKSIRSLTDKHA